MQTKLHLKHKKKVHNIPSFYDFLIYNYHISTFKNCLTYLQVYNLVGKKFKGFNVITWSATPSTSSLAFFSLSFAFVTYKFNLDDDVINVCRTEDVRKVSNSPPNWTSYSMVTNFSLFWNNVEFYFCLLKTLFSFTIDGFLFFFMHLTMPAFN
jgi:hypothetical protein